MATTALLIHSAAQLCVLPAHAGGPQRGNDLGDLGLIEDGAIAIDNGRITAVGTTSELQKQFQPQQQISAAGQLILPGFIDPHTHIPWAGDRAHEFEQRISGATYMEIMNTGGGIMSTVRQTRAASLAQLVAENLPRARRMLAHGTTTAEAKTGYGLDSETELKQLEAIHILNEQQPIEFSATFLPAHAVPPNFPGGTDGYVNHVINDMLPAAQAWQAKAGIPLFCDVFCEEGVFDRAQTERILRAAQGMGFQLKLHADEFVGLGGTKLAVELGAVSADHLVQTPDADIAALGSGNTIAVGLPGTPFGLGHHEYTPAKRILAANGALALATDCNPGTSWCESQQMVLALACRYMGLTQAQALAAVTINAACAIGRQHEVGSLEIGKQADLLLLAIPDYRQLGYRFGSNLVQQVFKKGTLVVENQSG